MILLRRIIPFFSPILLAAAYSGLFFYSLYWRWWIAILLGVTLFSIGILTRWQWKTSSFWLMLFPLVVLVSSATGVLFFLEHTFLYIVCVIFVLFCVSVYTEAIFTSLYQSHYASRFSLTHISILLYTADAFFLASLIFALRLVYTIPFWIITAGGAAFIAIMMVHVLHGYHAWKIQHAGVVSIVTLLIAEFLWALQFFPTSFVVNGFLFAAVVYCLPSLLYLQLRDSWSRALSLRYVSISVGALLLVLLTAQWN